MLAVSLIRCADVDDCGVGAGIEMEEIGPVSDLDFDFTVDDINFEDFFLRLEDGDALPDLEVDPAEIFTDFEAIATGSDGVMDQEVPSVQPLTDAVHSLDALDPCSVVLGEDNTTRADVEEGKGECNHAEEVVQGNGDFGDGGGTVFPEEKSLSSTTSSSQEAESQHKSSSKYLQGKKKSKVRMHVNLQASPNSNKNYKDWSCDTTCYAIFFLRWIGHRSFTGDLFKR
jgi:hypothetical protein